jgi:hypothetical protein
MTVLRLLSERILGVNKRQNSVMNEQTVLAKFSKAESVCKSCKHFTKLEGRHFCLLLGALLAEQTLYIPCDLKKTS